MCESTVCGRVESECEDASFSQHTVIDSQGGEGIERSREEGELSGGVGQSCISSVHDDEVILSLTSTCTFAANTSQGCAVSVLVVLLD